MSAELAPDWVVRQFAAVEKGDMEAMRESFAPDAIVWHNDDCVERSVDQVIAMFEKLHTIFTGMRYEDRRVAAIGNVRFVQQVAIAELRTGKTLRLHSMMRIELAADGRVSRIEEYYDGKALEAVGLAL